MFAHLGQALAAAGAPPQQVAKITIYVAHHRPEHLPVIEEARLSLFGDHKPADTVVGVETLARPEYLVIYGTARITGGGAAELLQRLARTYLGPDVRFPPMDSPPPGYITHITVDRISGVGPWAARS